MNALDETEYLLRAQAHVLARNIVESRIFVSAEIEALLRFNSSSKYREVDMKIINPKNYYHQSYSNKDFKEKFLLRTKNQTSLQPNIK